MDRSSPLRLALGHLAPELGQREANTHRVSRLLERAAEAGARWVLTPELVLTGYDFLPSIGSGWIRPAEEDPWVAELGARAQHLGLILLLSHPVREPDGACFNAVIALGEGRPRVVHRKLSPLPGVEGWSARGASARPTLLDGVSVGVIVCADAWRPEPCAELARAGARMILSPAAWPPEPHGPEGCWARRARETGVPLLISNRFGREPELDFVNASTGVYDQGRPVFEHSASEQGLVLVDWEPHSGRPIRADFLSLDATR